MSGRKAVRRSLAKDVNRSRVDRLASISVEMQRVLSTLRWRRQYLGLTGVELATRLGIRRGNLYEMEAGRRLPKGGTLLRWMQALEMRLELVPFEGDTPNAAIRLSRAEQREAHAGISGAHKWRWTTARPKKIIGKSRRSDQSPALSPESIESTLAFSFAAAAE